MRAVERSTRLARFLAMMLGVCLVFLCAGTAQAFWTGAHYRITHEALAAASIAPQPGATWEFSSDVRATIGDHNNLVDWDTELGTVPGTAHQHFDANLLAAGAAYVRNARGRVIAHLELAEAAMAPGSTIPDAEAFFEENIESAHSWLGKAHHAIQDFYSHSNWVELGRGGVAPMLWLGGKGANPFPPYSPGRCTCGDTGTEVATGIYGSNEEMVAAVRNGICIHGPAEIDDDLAPVASCPLELPGLGKDWWTAPRYEAAIAKAVQATAGFTQGIVYEARDKQLYVALCGFLGYDGSRKCLRSTEPVEVEVTPPLTFSQFSLGAYKTAEAFSLRLPKFDGSLGHLRGVTTKWEVVVGGTASCPPNPGAAMSGATVCLMTRRITPITLTSPDIGTQVVGLSCSTQSNRVSVCGFPDFFDGYGFDVFTWGGGTYAFDEDSDDFSYEHEFRFLSPGSGFVGAANEFFRVDGAFTTRALFYLGFETADDIFFYPNTGHHFSLTDGYIQIRVTLTYEYVEDATVQQ